MISKFLLERVNFTRFRTPHLSSCYSKILSLNPHHNIRQTRSLSEQITRWKLPEAATEKVNATPFLISEVEAQEHINNLVNSSNILLYNRKPSVSSPQTALIRLYVPTWHTAVAGTFKLLVNYEPPPDIGVFLALNLPGSSNIHAKFFCARPLESPLLKKLSDIPLTDDTQILPFSLDPHKMLESLFRPNRTKDLLKNEIIDEFMVHGIRDYEFHMRACYPIYHPLWVWSDLHNSRIIIVDGVFGIPMEVPVDNQGFSFMINGFDLSFLFTSLRDYVNQRHWTIAENNQFLSEILSDGEVDKIDWKKKEIHSFLEYGQEDIRHITDFIGWKEMINLKWDLERHKRLGRKYRIREEGRNDEMIGEKEITLWLRNIEWPLAEEKIRVSGYNPKWKHLTPEELVTLKIEKDMKMKEIEKSRAKEIEILGQILEAKAKSEEEAAKASMREKMTKDQSKKKKKKKTNSKNRFKFKPAVEEKPFIYSSFSHTKESSPDVSRIPGEHKKYYQSLGLGHLEVIPGKDENHIIRQAYHSLQKIWHPDKNKSEEATAKTAEINEAWEMLETYEGRIAPIDDRS